MGSTATSISKNISVPRPLAKQVDEKLAVGAFGQVPRGAWTTLVVNLLSEWVAEQRKTQLEDEIEATLQELGQP